MTFTNEYPYNKFLIIGNNPITKNLFNQSLSNSKCPTKPNFCLGSALVNAYSRRLQVLHREIEIDIHENNNDKNGNDNSRHIHETLSEILNIEYDTKPACERVKLACVFLGSERTIDDETLFDVLGAVTGASGDVGINDRGVPLKEVSSIIDLFSMRGIKLIIVTSGGDIDSKVEESVKLNSVSVVNLSDVLSKSKTPCDKKNHLKVTMTNDDCKLLYNHLLETIMDNWPELHPDNLPFKFPHWTQLTPDTDLRKNPIFEQSSKLKGYKPVSGSSSKYQFNKFLMLGDSLTEFAFKQFPLDEEGAVYEKPIFTLGTALNDIRNP
ncbi:unnamed protein product [Ambrosiozyma monospora]|uniref:Unnamed protein product n=1 Tax=Ambrosiozyma monospora TaxID=43982 RepID=A0A9W6YUN8_AMBMO|nr:unnamed protein product [Ambrosiozyma monospora]